LNSCGTRRGNREARRLSRLNRRQSYCCCGNNLDVSSGEETCLTGGYDLTLKPIILISFIEEDTLTLLESKKALTTSKIEACFSLDAEISGTRRGVLLLLLEIIRIGELWILSSKSKIISLSDELSNDCSNLRVQRNTIRDVVIALTQQVFAKDVDKLLSGEFSRVKPLEKTNKDVLANKRKLVDHHTVLSKAERSTANEADADESGEVLRGNHRMREGLEVQHKKACNHLSIIDRGNGTVHTGLRVVSIESCTKSQHGRVSQRHVKQISLSRRAVGKNLKGVVNDIRHQCTWGNCFAKRKTKNAICSWRGYSWSSNWRRNLSRNHLLLMYSQKRKITRKKIYHKLVRINTKKR